MNKQVLKKLVTEGFKSNKGCPAITEPMSDYIGIAKCMRTIGVQLKTATSSMLSADQTPNHDEHDLFHAFSPELEYNLAWRREKWFDRHYEQSVLEETKYSWKNIDKSFQGSTSGNFGFDAANRCCSKRDVITFHRLSGPVILWVDFMYNNFTVHSYN